jgi:hypothetical protein
MHAWVRWDGQARVNQEAQRLTVIALSQQKSMHIHESCAYMRCWCY